MSDGRRSEALGKIGAAVSGAIDDGAVVGLGSGTTMAAVLPAVVRELESRAVRARWVPTSLQIALVAQSLGQDVVSIDRPVLDLVVDGADQVDSGLNLIKGGGGALFREKVLIGNARTTMIVVDERKLAGRLCASGVPVPVEAHPFARVPVMERLRALGGEPRLRLGERGFPFYTENGDLIFDTGFAPLEAPAEMEGRIKSIPGVVESGIFTPREVAVYVVQQDGGYRVLERKKGS